MPFVKLDCGILRSTVWMNRDDREVFITALLMAEPQVIDSPSPQIDTRTLELTGWSAPPGWYGFVPAAGIGIIRTAGVDREAGMDALARLGAPDPESRSPDHEGRRLIRVDGGYLVLNFIKYRDRDYTGAERMRRYRERLKQRSVTRNDAELRSNETKSSGVQRHETQAEVRGQSADQEKTNGSVEPDAVSRVFSHWCTTFAHPRAVLDDKRRKLIAIRLKTFSAETLCQAFDGYRASAFHMGENDRHQRYDAIELILRDAQHVEAGVELAAKAPLGSNPATSDGGPPVFR